MQKPFSGLSVMTNELSGMRDISIHPYSLTIGHLQIAQLDSKCPIYPIFSVVKVCFGVQWDCALFQSFIKGERVTVIEEESEGYNF